MADIAQACGRGPRALQLAFRRGAGTNPWAYVRAVRLSRAHAQLVREGPDTATVLGIAVHWGFTNRSRFSSEYRRRYHEPPGVTLRRPWTGEDTDEVVLRPTA